LLSIYTTKVVILLIFIGISKVFIKVVPKYMATTKAVWFCQNSTLTQWLRRPECMNGPYI